MGSGYAYFPNIELSRDVCIKCGACIELCPMDVFRWGGEFPAVTYGSDCQSCFLCEWGCPTGAIRVDLVASETS